MSLRLPPPLAILNERSAVAAKLNALLLPGKPCFRGRSSHHPYSEGADRRWPARWLTGAHTAQHAKRTPAAPRRPISERHQMYEAEKRDWLRWNENATPEEYEAAMRRIARELGI